MKKAFVLVALAGMVSIASAEGIVGLTLNNELVRFDSASPNATFGTVAVSGLQAGERLLGIDFRPATGQLFGIGSDSRLYKVNVVTGVATQVGSGQFSTLLTANNYGFDFNPTVDRIRVVGSNGQNLRLNPITGGVAAVDGTIVYAAGDTNANVTPSVVGSAYTNNFNGASSTTLYNIDLATGALVTQIPPNNGVLNTVGMLGAAFDVNTGFDISSQTGVAFASLNSGGLTRLYTINLATGAATLVGTVGAGLSDISVFIPTAPSVAALGLGGVVALRRRR
ncbi:MAG: DUF4394 domain-containing protein [Planctomycetes bacterium]|nr:DUF4394 domain-containing protein [Planctomycetota bacterium]